jgi:hypothetical protein
VVRVHAFARCSGRVYIIGRPATRVNGLDTILQGNRVNVAEAGFPLLS